MNKKPTLTEKYIEILEYANSHDYFTLEELFSEIKTNEFVKRVITRKTKDNEFFQVHFIDNVPSGKKAVLSLTPNECYNLLQYQQFQMAKKSSTRATWFAIGALLVSIVGFAINILIHFEVL